MKIKRLQEEYKGQLTPILKTLGIKYHHERQCNGKAERPNRTLNNMVGAMLAPANIPNTFWADAMKGATYLRYRLFKFCNRWLDPICWTVVWKASAEERPQRLKLRKLFGGIMYPNWTDRNTIATSSLIVTSRVASLGTFSRLPRIATVLLERRLFSQTTVMETEFPVRSDYGDLPDEDFRRLHGKIQVHPTKSHDEDAEETTMPDTDSEDEHVVCPIETLCFYAEAESRPAQTHSCTTNRQLSTHWLDRVSRFVKQSYKQKTNTTVLTNT